MLPVAMDGTSESTSRRWERDISSVRLQRHILDWRSKDHTAARKGKQKVLPESTACFHSIVYEWMLVSLDRALSTRSARSKFSMFGCRFS